jgi:hypothetical protein
VIGAVVVIASWLLVATDAASTQADADRKDWLSEFPSYPGASKVCSGHVLGRADGKRREIAFSLYATKDDPASVVRFYASVRGVKSELGDTTLTTRSTDGKKVLSIHPVSGSYPDCGVKPPKDAKTVVVVSQMTP